MYCFVLVVQVSARVFPGKDYGNFCQVKDFVAYVPMALLCVALMSISFYRLCNLWYIFMNNVIFYVK